MVNKLFKNVLGVISFLGFVFSLSSLSFNVTGQSISSLEFLSGNPVWIAVLLASFLLAFFALRD